MSGRNTRQSLASATRSSGRLTPAPKAMPPNNKKEIIKEDNEAIAMRKNQPLKKRPLPASMSIPTINKKIQIQKTEVRRTITPSKLDKPLSTNVATATETGRSRRTPKPNPKYTNENLVTSFNPPSAKVAKPKSGSEDEDDINDEFNIEHGDTDDITEEDEIFSATDDSSDYDEFEKEKLTRSTRATTSSVTKKIGVQLKPKAPMTNITKQIIKPGIRSILTASMDKQKLQTSVQSNILRKRKIDPDHDTDSPTNKRINIGAKFSDEERTKRFQLLKAQLDLKNKSLQQQKPTPEQQKKLLEALKAARSQQQAKVQQIKETDIQKKSSSTVSKSVDEDGDDMDDDIDDDDDFDDEDNEINDDDDDDKDPIGSDDATAATLDDFETMPTFTIVNVNDIIGKKGNVLLEKSDDIDNEGKINNTKILITSPKSKKDNQFSRDKKNIDSISLTDSLGEGRATRSSTLLNNASRNRRKTMHTTILSDKIDKSNEKPPPRTPFPPPRKQVPTNTFSRTPATKKPVVPINSAESRPPIKKLNNNSIIKNKNNSMESLKSNSTPQSKPSPRILNSLVGKKPTPITSISTKPSQPIQLLNNLKSKENQQLNLTLNNNKSKISSSSSPTIPQPLKRKVPQLPSEKVVITRQGNKIIKKITCFETWYVINLPKEENEEDESKKVVPPVGRKIAGILNKTTNNGNQLKIPLIQLANNIDKVKLPSDKWIPKVTLQKISNTQKEFKKNEKYTGKISDSNFSENDRNSLTPLNVMFRRVPLNPTPKLPYDRAVIFKNQTFFTNIDGKNIRLIDAPKEIENTVDIEILLEIINDLKLNSTFVEPTSYLG